MNDRTRARPEVIGTPERALEIWSAESTYTEAGPAAGVPVPSAATQLALSASGEQSAAIDIRTQDGGVPSLDSTAAGVHQGATFLVKSSSDTDWLGHDPPYPLRRWEVIEADTTTPEFIVDPSCVTCDDGTILVAADVRDSGVSPQYVLRIYRRSVTTGAWSNVDISNQNTAPTGRKPALLILPSGRVHVYEWVSDAYLRLWYSDDNGATWSHGGDKINDYAVPASNTVERCRVAYSSGQCLMLVDLDNGGTKTIWQLASSDLGLTFQQVVIESGGGGNPALGDVAARAEGGFVVVGAEVETTAGAHAYVLADAYATFSSQPAIDISSSMSAAPGGVEEDDDLAVVTDDTGMLYCYGRINDTPYAALSYDGGASWVDFLLEVFTGMRFPTSGDRIDAYCATAHRGRIALVHTWTVGTASWASGLGICYLGGYTSATMAAINITQSARYVLGWRYWYIPIELPGNAGWTMAGGGSESLTTTIGVLTMTTSAATRTASVTPGTGDGRFRIVLTPTCTTVGDQRATYSNGTIQVSVRMSNASWELWDDLAASIIGGAVSGSWSTSGLEVWVEMDTSATAVQSWYRVPSTDENAEWIAGPASTSLTSGAPARVFRWGHEVSHTATSEWREVVYDDTASAASRRVPLTRPTGLRGREMAGAPYADEGVVITPRGGPTWRGEQWVIPTRATYRLEQATQIASPRVSWRSTTVGAQTIALRWDDSGATRGPSDLLALTLRNQNITRMTISYYNGSTWVALRSSFDPGVLSLSYIRSGRAVRPGATGNAPYLTHGEYAGGTILLDGVAHRIDSHSEGRWSSAYPLQPRVRIIGDVSSTGTSGDAYIIPQDIALILDLSGLNAQGVRIEIPSALSAAADAPAESYWQIGSLQAFWLHPTGHPSDYGAVRTTEAHNETVTTRDGQHRINRTAPITRAVQVTWRAVHQFEVEDEAALPGFLRADNTITPSASGGGTAYVLDGVYQEINGEEASMFYGPALPTLTPGSVTVLTRRRDFYVGRITSGGITRTNEVGEHGQDELVSVGAITITEDA